MTFHTDIGANLAGFTSSLTPLHYPLLLTWGTLGIHIASFNIEPSVKLFAQMCFRLVILIVWKDWSIDARNCVSFDRTFVSFLHLIL